MELKEANRLLVKEKVRSGVTDQLQMQHLHLLPHSGHFPAFFART
jgi:hypothetical protein